MPLPETTLELTTYSPGWRHRFGPLSLSVPEIKAYAAVVDPQPVHLDEAYAQTTRFGGLIASGLQPYSKYHAQFWVPLTAQTFICGISIEGAQFAKPVYPDQPFWGELSITDTTPKPEKGTVIVGWLWVFTDEAGVELQRVGYHSYHKLLTA